MKPVPRAPSDTKQGPPQLQREGAAVGGPGDPRDGLELPAQRNQRSPQELGTHSTDLAERLHRQPPHPASGRPPQRRALGMRLETHPRRAPDPRSARSRKTKSLRAPTGLCSELAHDSAENPHSHPRVSYLSRTSDRPLLGRTRHDLPAGTSPPRPAKTQRGGGHRAWAKGGEATTLPPAASCGRAASTAARGASWSGCSPRPGRSTGTAGRSAGREAAPAAAP